MSKIKTILESVLQERLEDIISKYTNLSEDEQIEAVKYDPADILYIDNPSEKVQLAAVRTYGGVLSKIMKLKKEGRLQDGPSDMIIRAAIENYPFAIVNLPTNMQTQELQSLAVSEKPNAVLYIWKPTEQTWKEIKDQYPQYFDVIYKNWSENYAERQARKAAKAAAMTNTKKESELDEGFGKTLGTLATAAAIGLGGLQGADAKTNPELLRRSGHEITTQYEHGGKGYAAITKDNYGGFSYGKEQLSTRRIDDAPSTFDKFLDYLKDRLPDAYNKLENAGGWKAAFAGQTSFKNAWLKLIEDKKFTDCYDDFITDTMILPVYNRMDQAKSVNLDKVTTWGSENPAVQAAIRSVIIQHGRVGAFDLIKQVVKQKNPKNPNEFLDALYELRAKKFSKYKSRYASEHNALNNYLNSLDTGTVPTKLA